MSLKQYIGDDVVHKVNLTVDGREGSAAFTPGAEYALTFTLKNHITDADTAALCQKVSDNGITVTGSEASIELLRIDSVSAKEGEAVFDIKATSLATGKAFTCARNVILMERPVMLGVETSIPIHTTAPPAPFAASVNFTNVTDSLSGLTTEQRNALRAILAAVGVQLAPLPE